MRSLLLKIALYLLGHSSKDAIRRTEQKDIDDWLVSSYRHPGFHDYISYENLTILKTGMNSTQTGDKYSELVGARINLKKLAALAKEKYSKYIKEEARKQPVKAKNEEEAVERLERNT